jgi:L-ornithine Nalpha-acyltransferase
VLSQSPGLTRARFTARFAATPEEIIAAQSLRHLSFRASRHLSLQAGLDSDRFDPLCQHMLITEADTGRLVCCYRLLTLKDGRAIGQSYAAQFYGLDRLADFPGPLLELGRFCLHPDSHDPDILRLAWAALTRLVDESGARMLFGCSSFPGTDPEPHLSALACLAARHLAPQRWSPAQKAGEVIDLTRIAAKPDPRAMPQLLRTYLSMGAWVSDHAVIDRDLHTLHVFTGLDISTVPPARARALRALARG